ncbi:bidirectional sugar transporter SWEET1a isoform X2 [Nicotiana tabacum]|uniref:Bidirectional sugar transporter SWEET1a isoform X2 n=2 Tax=Nicotiana TaxID=4085 RepID=A0A1S4C5Z6_TOBAC|nr:PREDICTED: bidirectional sugar transporter SWEET1-like isoform X2 [Nicotiana sylvestris]XP_016496632.1 PREDICTED: bidirectional sugar transporter SWEET1a-like isoform X2 [Nicotiana tabacum]
MLSTPPFGILGILNSLLLLLAPMYSLPFVSPNNMLVTIIGASGTSIQATYVLIFLIFAPSWKEKAKISGILFLLFLIFSTVALVSIFALHGYKRMLFCGLVSAIVGISMYGSPLTIMRLVIKTKSVEYMPLFLSIFAFTCSITWLVYGLLGADPFIYVPNVVGALLGLVQLILYAVYRDIKREVKKEAVDESVKMELENPNEEKIADTQIPMQFFSHHNGQILN